MKGKEDITQMANKIKNAGGKLYLVGGAVRDQIIGKENIDEDYCVTGISKQEFEEIFPDAHLRGKFFAVYEINGKEFALARKERKKGKGHKEFEIYTDKKITIQEDLERRDITINSIAKDVLTNEYIDPFHGIEDIKQRRIRLTSNAFKEDPLRVYRVARFAATLNFGVEENTIKQMKMLRNELETLSKERIFQEFKKALEGDKPSMFFETLRKAEVLDVHFKEIYNLIGQIQPEKYHPEGDSYKHTMIVVDSSCGLTNNLEIRFSCLVHDLGKGTTPKEILPHHYGHEERGEKLVISLSNRIGLPKIWTKCGQVSAKEHMKGGMFDEMTPKKQLEFIEKVSKSPLGLKGMKTVVMCDKYRNNEYPKNIEFDEIGDKCLSEIDGKYIINKYHLEEGLELKNKLHEERIRWLKEYKKDIKRSES